jgi:dTDP-4-amino-4,6-dideoxygalactose transaminase
MHLNRRSAKKTGVRHAVALASGTAALHLALRILAEGSESLVENHQDERKC